MLCACPSMGMGIAVSSLQAKRGLLPLLCYPGFDDCCARTVHPSLLCGGSFFS